MEDTVVIDFPAMEQNGRIELMQLVRWVNLTKTSVAKCLRNSKLPALSGNLRTFWTARRSASRSWSLPTSSSKSKTLNS
ncbi:hypothetical protein LX99_00185 [Mucilaginibacter oryzae]|uniref:Uncharacterized protein n=1 Tax=Mucilaginibacter oryzae TaxID=468058 RepID=A0A316HND4_9SPHI|nr:hypothetical protein LX99_00185 [Mucilaginibacter oryzae]